MSIQEIVAGSSGALLVLMTLVQIAPINVNPWSVIGRGCKKIMSSIGSAIHGDIIGKLDKLQEMQTETKSRLDGHIYTDDERNADLHRVQILRFNRELLQDLPHTQEDFIEALSEIDFYERYCREHPEYENNRAVLAIQNIERVYSDRLEKHDFGNA